MVPLNIIISELIIKKHKVVKKINREIEKQIRLLYG